MAATIAAARGMKKTKSSSSLPGNLNAEKTRASSYDPSPLCIQKVHPPKPYSERTREELICEIDFMKDKLRVAHASVSNSKAALALQKQRTRNAVSAWRHRVDECRARTRSERAAHDQQMATIVSSLLAFEEQLKQEQKTIVKTLEEKDSQIMAQQRRIEALTTANERLMKAMGRKQRSASVDRWSELSEDEALLPPRPPTSGGTNGGAISPITTATSPVGPPAPFPGYSSPSSSLSVPSTLPSPNGLYPHYATAPRVTRSTTPKQQQQQHHRSAIQTQQLQQQQLQQQQQQQQPTRSNSRSSCDTLKEISNMKLPGSGGVYGRAGALKLILSSTTSESDDSKTNSKKTSSTTTKKNNGKSLSCAAKNNNNNSNSNIYAASSASSSSNNKEEDGGKVGASGGGGGGGGGGGARLVRRASASFRNWLSGSDRSDDDDARESGWYSDYDLTSYRRHAVHLNGGGGAGSRAASNAAIVAGLAAAASGGNPKSSSSSSSNNNHVGGRGSTLSRTFKSLLSPNPKISTRRSKSPRVPVACSAAAAAAAAAAANPSCGGAVSSSSEDLAF